MNEDISREFSKRLKAWRLATNMTQQDLSELCGVSVQGISAIENESVQARTSTMDAIVRDGFEMTFERFFTEKPKARPRRQRVSGVVVPNLRKWRALANPPLTTKKLAQIIGLKTSAAINYIENGGAASPAVAQRIAAVFGKTLEEMENVPTVDVNTDSVAIFAKGKTIKDIARELDMLAKPIRDAQNNVAIGSAVEMIQDS